MYLSVILMQSEILYYSETVSTKINPAISPFSSRVPMSVEAIAVPNPSPSTVNVGKTNRDNMEGDPDVKVKRKVPGEVPAMGRMTHEAAAFEKSLQKKSLQKNSLQKKN